MNAKIFQRCRRVGVGVGVLASLAWLHPVQASEEPTPMPLDNALHELGVKLDACIRNSGLSKVGVLPFQCQFRGKTERVGNAGTATRYLAEQLEAKLFDLRRNRPGFELFDQTTLETYLTGLGFQTPDLPNEEGMRKLRAGADKLDGLVVTNLTRLGESLALNSIMRDCRTGKNLDAFAVRVNRIDSDLRQLFGDSWLALQSPESKDLVVEFNQDVGGTVGAPGLPPMLEAKNPYRVEVLVAGKPLPFFKSGAELWVAATPGTAYVIRLENRSDKRVGAAVLIDGLPVIGARKAGASGKLKEMRERPSKITKYILGPRQSGYVAGWSDDLESHRQFVFATGRQSLSRQMGFHDPIGAITVSFYPEVEGSRGVPSEGAGTAEGPEFKLKLEKVKVSLRDEPAGTFTLRYDFEEQVKGFEKVK